MSLRTLIVDDEAPARALLREYLAAHADVEVVGECANGFEAVKAVSEHAPDLLLLDIQMPKLDGFDVLELVGEGPQVVFCTAYDQHALRAFQVHAVDYLLKPFAPERLAEALDLVRAKLAARAVVPVAALVADARPPGRFLERVLVRDGAKVHVFPVERVDYFESQDDYVAIHCEGKVTLKPQTLGELERALDPARFVRVHRSVILNLERLARLERYAKDSHVAILRDGGQVPVSRAGHARLRELMG